jgi:CheY-like chemotaxis protein
MSHELRTPLNSLLILSKLLSENVEGNLSAKQVEFAQTINSAGSDLLSLINDILDLAKIESGTMAVDVDEYGLPAMREYVERTFRQVAVDRKLGFEIDLVAPVPDTMYTDARRLQQVLKNLLANAFKFTEAGTVKLEVSTATAGWSFDSETLNRAESVVAFSVVDTGIGIPENKQRIIFEAFQQADGTTSRKYGGTGLGLSISREIAKLLGGEITVKSTPGKGSTFTLFLPRTYVQLQRPGTNPGQERIITPAPGTLRNVVTERPTVDSPFAQQPDAELATDVDPMSDNAVEDDRKSLGAGEKMLLVVEDDLAFAKIVRDMAREKGFKVVVATRGDTGLALARELKPDAISLDLRLPGIDGWSVLDRLKHDARTRHIPVHIISAEDDDQHRGLKQGAIASIRKPISREELGAALTNVKGFLARPVKELLVIEDDDTQRQSVIELIGNGDVHTTGVASGAEALEAMKQTEFDCVVLDLGLPDMPGIELIEQMKRLAKRKLPIIVYTGKELTSEEESELARVTDAIIVKSARSPEHLLDETALFLHRVEARLPEPKRNMLKQVHLQDPVLRDRKVLVVDDDVRNIFAIASVLERHHMQVVYAENGRKGIEVLEKTPGIDVVLMDVMMPEMDGYETMTAIRQLPAFKALPIIALTAKAMKGDREKCIEAGASDYITKPVDTEQLLSLLRVWLYSSVEKRTATQLES